MTQTPSAGPERAARPEHVEARDHPDTAVSHISAGAGLRFLAEAGALLAASPDYAAALTSVAQLAVPFFADWCAIYVREPDGRLQRVATASATPTRPPLTGGPHGAGQPGAVASRGSGRGLRMGEPEIYPDTLSPQPPGERQDPQHLELLLQLGLRSAIIVPLRARGQMLGTLLFGLAESGRRYREADLLPAQELAHRAALAVDNTRLSATVAESEVQIAQLASTDPLTGLPNRAAFMERLAEALVQAQTDGSTVAVLFVDLDRFKVVNGGLGHATADVLLAAVADRLAKAIAPRGIIARFGDDEFTALLRSVSGEQEAVAVADGLIGALSNPFTVEGRELFTAASIGVALSPRGAVPEDQLLRHADSALHHAKEAGRGRTALFQQAETTRRHQRMALETELWRAAERNELLLLYQPTVHLQSGAIAGMEALVRWQHPRLGLVSPSDFIPLAEETGQILGIGTWMLTEACRRAAEWLRRSPGPLVMSVNLSALEFQHPDLLRRVADVLRETGLPPAALKIEITEGALMADAESTVETLRALKRLGVGLALDDFGTGYSSLNYLRRFPVDTLKIDRSFVTEVGHNAGSLAIVRALIALSHALGMDVTAEGIETPVQLARLRDAYCDYGQGFLYSEPIPPEAIDQLLGGR